MTIDKWLEKYEQQFSIFHDIYTGICEEIHLMEIHEELMDDPFTEKEEVSKAFELIQKVQMWADVDDFTAVENIHNYLNNKFYQIIA